MPITPLHSAQVPAETNIMQLYCGVSVLVTHPSFAKSNTWTSGSGVSVRPGTAVTAAFFSLSITARFLSAQLDFSVSLYPSMAYITHSMI